MAQVTVTIAGKTYRMACDDGQEPHLLALASRLDATIDSLRTVFGEIGDQRLTVMSAITVLDQQAETERRLAAAEERIRDLEMTAQAHDQRQRELEGRLADAVAEAAERLEQLADALDGRSEPATPAPGRALLP
jgi:cell division protein ZapA